MTEGRYAGFVAVAVERLLVGRVVEPEGREVWTFDRATWGAVRCGALFAVLVGRTAGAGWRAGAARLAATGAVCEAGAARWAVAETLDEAGAAPLVEPVATGEAVVRWPPVVSVARHLGFALIWAAYACAFSWLENENVRPSCSET